MHHKDAEPQKVLLPHSIPEAIYFTNIEFELFNDSRPVGMPIKPKVFYIRGVSLSKLVNSVSFAELQNSVEAADYKMLLAANRGEIKVTIVKSLHEYRRNQTLRFQ